MNQRISVELTNAAGYSSGRTFQSLEVVQDYLRQLPYKTMNEGCKVTIHFHKVEKPPKRYVVSWTVNHTEHCFDIFTTQEEAEKFYESCVVHSDYVFLSEVIK